ncbi:hypothetical protein GWI33_020732 [Rhynchophorus ferrugineus]|uniref:Uncharacterized protein n=1 Tax=Rhynchophorus ferrugineus TaxID=354439 RepID=A0A834HP61_RHYFE|nr:hypothetical protein GWI33_020732 [Rhynchophorus ferrugineus]
MKQEGHDRAVGKRQRRDCVQSSVGASISVFFADLTKAKNSPFTSFRTSKHVCIPKSDFRIFAPKQSHCIYTRPFSQAYYRDGQMSAGSQGGAYTSLSARGAADYVYRPTTVTGVPVPSPGLLDGVKKALGIFGGEKNERLLEQVGGSGRHVVIASRRFLIVTRYV